MREFDKQSGAGLVSAIVAIALLSVGLVIVTGLINNVSKTRQAVELKADATRLKKNLLSGTNCRSIAVCQPNQLRALVDYEGHTMVNAGGTTKFGSWTVQARCQADRSLEVRVALLDAKGNPVKDPLRGKLMDWQAPEGILIEKGILCGIINTDFGAVQQFSIQTSSVCAPEEGSCPPVPEKVVDPLAANSMCCDDGRDRPKPKCPGQSVEYAAYWDRQDDWGMGGQWVVLCQ